MKGKIINYIRAGIQGFTWSRTKNNGSLWK